MQEKEKRSVPVATEQSASKSGVDTDISIPKKSKKSISMEVRPEKPAVKKKQRVDTRQRNFATVVYPESAPANWRDVLNEAHVAALISPLHDKDFNPSGEPKKPHYHVMVMYEGKKCFETQVKPLFDAIGGVGREAVNSARGYARYLCHLDNPEKAQYNTADVVQLGGADYVAIIHLATDDSKMLVDIFSYIKVNQIYSFSELVDVCAVNNMDWFNMITMSRAYIVDKYIKSLAWEASVDYRRSLPRDCAVDQETGEVVEGQEGEEKAN